MENVVVVVVVTTREGSLGSGPRFDWENLSDARFWAASSLEREGVEFGKGEEKGNTDVENELGNVRKNCLCVESWRETIKVAKRSRVSCGIDR